MALGDVDVGRTQPRILRMDGHWGLDFRYGIDGCGTHHLVQLGVVSLGVRPIVTFRRRGSAACRSAVKKETMTSSKRIGGIVLGIFAIALVSAKVMPFRIASGVTVERVRALRPGMREAELLQALGQPLGIRAWGSDAKLLDYVRETPLMNHSPNLWVLVRNGVVEEVQAQRTVHFIERRGCSS